jgi:hypothetical protein
VVIKSNYQSIPLIHVEISKFYKYTELNKWSLDILGVVISSVLLRNFPKISRTPQPSNGAALTLCKPLSKPKKESGHVGSGLAYYTFVASLLTSEINFCLAGRPIVALSGAVGLYFLYLQLCSSMLSFSWSISYNYPPPTSSRPSFFCSNFTNSFNKSFPPTQTPVRSRCK